MPTKKRTRSPDPRTESDRPGVRICLRLSQDEADELDWWRGDLDRSKAVHAALKEKYLRFARKK